MAKDSIDQTVHDGLVEKLASMVFDAGVAGAVLPTEQQLVERLQVGRSTLREAVKILVAKGLIEVRPRTGTRVRPRHLWNILDADVLRWSAALDSRRTTVELNELRRAIEPAAADLAARYAGGDDVAALWRHFVRMEDAVAVGDVGTFIEADALFHRQLLEAGGNGIFRSLGHVIDAALYESFSSIASEIGDVHDSVALHRAVVVAVSARNPAEAVASMTEVIDATVRRIGYSRSSYAAEADTSADRSGPHLTAIAAGDRT